MNQSVLDKAMYYLKITAEAAGFSNARSLAEIIGSLIGAFLSLLGVIFLILIIYAGFLWMTSGGNEIKVLKAKKIIGSSIVGLIIILSAYSITAFVFNAVK
jgi:hypothetical protein